jgi:hemolysin III
MTIFVLIAGTYVPICLLALEGGWRVRLLSAVWELALCGILLKTLLDGGPKLTLGGPRPGDGLARLGGSLSHIPGRWDGQDPGRRAGLPRGLPDLWLQTPRPAVRMFGFHQLWHHFVLASSVCHFRVMLRYIAPLS